MYVAGYQFLVLNNLFMNHWGLQVLVVMSEYRIPLDCVFVFGAERVKVDPFSEARDATTVETDAAFA